MNTQNLILAATIKNATYNFTDDTVMLLNEVKYKYLKKQVNGELKDFEEVTEADVLLKIIFEENRRIEKGNPLLPHSFLKQIEKTINTGSITLIC